MIEKLRVILFAKCYYNYPQNPPLPSPRCNLFASDVFIRDISFVILALVS